MSNHTNHPLETAAELGDVIDAVAIDDAVENYSGVTVDNPEQLPVVESEGLPVGDADDTINPPTDAAKPELTPEEVQELVAKRQAQLQEMFKRMHAEQLKRDKANGITRVPVMGRVVAVKKRKSKFR